MSLSRGVLDPGASGAVAPPPCRRCRPRLVVEVVVVLVVVVDRVVVVVGLVLVVRLVVVELVVG